MGINDIATRARATIDAVTKSYWDWYQIGYQAAIHRSNKEFGSNNPGRKDLIKLLGGVQSLADSFGLKWYQRVPFYRGAKGAVDEIWSAQKYSNVGVVPT